MATWFALYEHPHFGRDNVRVGNVVLQEPTPQEVFNSLEKLSLEVSPSCKLGIILAEARITIYDYAGSGVRHVLEPSRPGATTKFAYVLRKLFTGAQKPQPVWRSAPAWGS